AKQATYSQDQKTALVNNPTGDLFQDGEVVLQVSAKSGEVKQDQTR
ncbi:MAG: LPS export ABC transporter periplasmic protein LptC, partial [Symploca sp. SIO2B6]|nr:LPS export ABC transporter periplasmic protein LptC [Symploca sp. SIO2B6]